MSRHNQLPDPQESVSEQPVTESLVQKITSNIRSVAAPSSSQLTKATTFEPSKFMVPDARVDNVTDDDAVSVTSFATSLADVDDHHHLKVPPMPASALGGKPFECPCCKSIQDCKRYKSWK